MARRKTREEMTADAGETKAPVQPCAEHQPKRAGIRQQADIGAGRLWRVHNVRCARCGAYLGYESEYVEPNQT